MKIAVFITSVINTHTTPLTYAQRSIFTPQQRFEQTLQTIESIKYHIPDATIYLVEGSSIDKHIEEKLQSLVNYYYNTSSIPYIKNAVDSPLKGYGEGAQTEYILNIIKEHRYDHILKISGRYIMGPKFKLENFIHENITQCRVNIEHKTLEYTTTPYNCSTVIIGIPYNKIEVIINALPIILQKYDTGAIQQYECVLTQNLWPINVIDTCGARGPVSVCNGYYICE